MASVMLRVDSAEDFTFVGNVTFRALLPTWLCRCREMGLSVSSDEFSESLSSWLVAVLEALSSPWLARDTLFDLSRYTDDH